MITEAAAILPANNKSNRHVYLGQNHSKFELRTWLVIGLSFSAMIIEITCGLLFNSWAVVADGLHMATHCIAFLIASVAYTYARNNVEDPRFTFGTGKVGELAAFSSALILVMIALLLIYESIECFIDNASIDVDSAIAAAFVGLSVNILSAIILGCFPGEANNGNSGGCVGHTHGPSNEKYEIDENLILDETDDPNDYHRIQHENGVIVLNVFKNGLTSYFFLDFESWQGMKPTESDIYVTVEYPQDGAMKEFHFRTVTAGSIRTLQSKDFVPGPYKFKVTVHYLDPVAQKSFSETVNVTDERCVDSRQCGTTHNIPAYCKPITSGSDRSGAASPDSAKSGGSSNNAGSNAGVNSRGSSGNYGANVKKFGSVPPANLISTVPQRPLSGSSYGSNHGSSSPTAGNGSTTVPQGITNLDHVEEGKVTVDDTVAPSSSGYNTFCGSGGNGGGGGAGDNVPLMSELGDLTAASTYKDDNNYRAAFVHIVADALVSILVVTALFIIKYYPSLYDLDPAVAIVGALVIISWGYTLVRDTSANLLDMNPDVSLTNKLLKVLEKDGSVVLDFHVWRLGPGHLGAIICVQTDKYTRDDAYYRRRIAGFKALSHVTIQISHVEVM